MTHEDISSHGASVITDATIADLRHRVSELEKDNFNLNEKIVDYSNKIEGFKNRLIEQVSKEADENDYCLDGQISFVAAVLDIPHDKAKSFFVETYHLSVTFTGPQGENHIHISHDEMAEFIQSYFEHTGTYLTVDVSSVDVY
jgi:NADH:ubiquinone oxidoreductase subunit E